MHTEQSRRGVNSVSPATKWFTGLGRRIKDSSAAAKRVELDKAPNFRLVNTPARDRAAWLESRIPELFLDVESGEEKG